MRRVSRRLFTFYILCKWSSYGGTEAACFMFYKKGVLRNFAKFTEKHQCQSVFFNKVAGRPCNFIKKETQAQVFSCEFCEIFKNTFSQGTPPMVATGGNLSLQRI